MDMKLAKALEQYVSGLTFALSGIVEGIYLTGSIALGAYHAGKSDVDFTVVVTRKLEENELKSILSLHKSIEKQNPKMVMEGHYVTADVLGKLPKEVEPVPVYYHGNLSPASYEGINLITWFTLKKYGVTLYGKPSNQLEFEVDIDLLRKRMHQNLNSYWVKWLKNISNLFTVKGLSSLSDGTIEWVVLGISRLYYTFKENDIASKDKAGEYALEHVPPIYAPIIKEALGIRKGNDDKLYFSVFKRRWDTIRYLDYMVHKCNRLFEEGVSECEN